MSPKLKVGVFLLSCTALAAVATPLVVQWTGTRWLEVPLAEWAGTTGARASSPADASTLFETSPVTRGIVRKRVQTAGTIRPVVTAMVGSQLSGQIREVRADFNAVVKAGDVLAVLDSKTFLARIEQAKADLEMAEAAHTNQMAALDKAQSNLRVAERAHTRLKDLHAKGVGSESQLDAALRDLEVGRAEIVIARAQVDSARANVAQRKAVLTQATIDLDRAEIRAPIAGMVISRSVEIGQTVAASLSAPELFRIAQDLRRLRIDAQVNEAEIGGVGVGNPASFRVDAYPGRVFSGTVSQIRLASTEENNIVTYTVVIEAANEDQKLYPGMTATAEIETHRREDVLRVPVDALRFKPRTVSTEPVATVADKAEKHENQLERLAKKLELTPAQLAAAKERLAAVEKSSAGKAASGEKGPRMSSTDRLEMIVEPLITDQQRELLVAWKSGRDNTNAASVWVLATDGTPVKRGIRVGLMDSSFVELVGNSVAEGEAVVVRSRGKPVRK
jgi:HlyD family secretion protein